MNGNAYSSPNTLHIDQNSESRGDIPTKVNILSGLGISAASDELDSLNQPAEVGDHYPPLLEGTPSLTQADWSYTNGLASPLPPKSPSEIHPSFGEFSPSAYRSPDISIELNEEAVEQAGRMQSLDKSRTTGFYKHARSESQPYTRKSHFSQSQPLHQSGSRPFYAAQQPAAFFGVTALIPPRLRQALDSPAAWLAYYFLMNLSLTLYNKMVLVQFPFGWALTAMHCLCGAAGSYFCKMQGVFTPATLTNRENSVLVAFSVLFCLNIATSNISLNLVSVPLHQVIRAMTPLFTIAISAIFLRKQHSVMTIVSLVPVVAGVGFATWGDYSCTTWGFFLTVLGTFLAALKTIVTNVIQVGRLKLHPLDLLLRMSPLAFIQCVIYSWATGELELVRQYGATQMTYSRFTSLVVNGMIAFLLNIVSFSANKKTSALTMTVAANVKQVLTILFAVHLFNLHITPTNLLGISLTLIGGAWYAYLGMRAKTRKAPTTPALSVATNEKS